jgi:hypothetical protein
MKRQRGLAAQRTLPNISRMIPGKQTGKKEKRKRKKKAKKKKAKKKAGKRVRSHRQIF